MSLIGRPAPKFSGKAAKSGEIVKIALDDYKGRWLVLFFYPLDFSFVCPTELVAFDKAHAKFAAAGAELLGVSVDSQHVHLAYMRTPREDAGVGALSYPLLSDLGHEIMRAYDVVHPEGDRALRGVFVIDPDGIVQSATINAGAIGRNVDEVFRTLRAAQHVREHGDTCPANWQDGDDGMIATREGVKQVITR